MNAVEKALRHIEKLQQRLIKAMPPKRKRRKARKPYRPPVTQPDVRELAETFAPPPTPPDVTTTGLESINKGAA